MSNEPAARLHLPPELMAERLAHERQWSEDAAARHLTAEDYVRWKQLRCTHRITVFDHKKMVLWRVREGKIADTSLIRVQNFAADARGSTCELDLGGREVLVDHTPTRISDGVFAWLPFYMDLRFVPSGQPEGRRTVRFSLVLRMASNPEKNSVEGAQYLGEENVFRNLILAGTT